MRQYDPSLPPSRIANVPDGAQRGVCFAHRTGGVHQIKRSHLSFHPEDEYNRIEKLKAKLRTETDKAVRWQIVRDIQKIEPKYRSQPYTESQIGPAQDQHKHWAKGEVGFGDDGEATVITPELSREEVDHNNGWFEPDEEQKLLKEQALVNEAIALSRVDSWVNDVGFNLHAQTIRSWVARRAMFPSRYAPKFPTHEKLAAFLNCSKQHIANLDRDFRETFSVRSSRERSSTARQAMRQARARKKPPDLSGGKSVLLANFHEGQQSKASNEQQFDT